MPGDMASTITIESCANAASRAGSSSSGEETFEMPTDDPNRAGFTKTGNPSEAAMSERWSVVGGRWART